MVAWCLSWSLSHADSMCFLLLAFWAQAGRLVVFSTVTVSSRCHGKMLLWQRGTWSVAVLNVPWEAIVVIVASVHSKQINLLTFVLQKTPEKSHEKVQYNFNYPLSFPTHKSFNSLSEDSTLEVHMCWVWGREDLLVSPAGFPLWVDFSENTQWHVFALYFREASSDHLVRSGPYGGLHNRLWANILTDQQELFSSQVENYVFTASRIRSDLRLDWQLSQQCSHAGCFDHLWTYLLLSEFHTFLMWTWSGESHNGCGLL